MSKKWISGKIAVLNKHKAGDMDIKQEINKYLNTLKTTIDTLDQSEIEKFIEILLDVYGKERNIYVFGNGGSASTASHFACDINKCTTWLDKKIKVVSLVDNVPSLMAHANDMGFENTFVEQLKNFLTEGDIVIGISGSGNSTNVLKAIEYANEKGNITIGVTGYDGGTLRKIVKHSINANINDMQISEDIHLIFSHIAMRLLETILTVKKNSELLSTVAKGDSLATK